MSHQGQLQATPLLTPMNQALHSMILVLDSLSVLTSLKVNEIDKLNDIIRFAFVSKTYKASVGAALEFKLTDNGIVALHS
jgi:hypothetical protein